jgi:hypothetical protein
MAKNIPEVDLLTDTFNSWRLRTNDIIDAIRTEVITANTSLGVTGTPVTPRNARLWGEFTANKFNGDALTVGSNNFVANTSAVLFSPSMKLYANNTSGNAGQVLTSTNTGVIWATAAGTGTVTNITSGNGVSFAGGSATNTITTTGTINVRANTGIVVNAGGVSVNTAYLNAELNPIRLLGQTWASPAAIGTGTSNTGTFSTVTAVNEYRIAGDDIFRITRSEIRTLGRIDASTPENSGTTGGVKVRGNSADVAYIQVTANNGSTEWGHFKAHSNGLIIWNGSLSATEGVEGGIPAGTKMLFVQSTAPVGWTANTSHNDKALRVVSSGGGANGGANGFSIVFGASGNTGGYAITNGQMPAHRHGIEIPGGPAGVGLRASNPTEAGGGIVMGNVRGDVGPLATTPAWVTFNMGGNDFDDPEGTPVAGLGFAKPHSHPLNINVAYVDVIIASKD